MNAVSTDVMTGLREAASAVERLATMDITVLSALANGRRPLIVVAAPPAFVRGVVKRSTPDGLGGAELLHAAPFHGVQLEWITHQRGAQAVRHG